MRKTTLFFAILSIFILIGFSGYAQLSNKVIAHRGAWKTKNIPENSIASLREAIALGCGGSEFDVWLTADHQVVVNHDPTFMGMDIEASTYQQLLTKKLPNGESIPTLEAYLNAGKGQRKTQLIFEIKTSRKSKERTLQLTEACVKTVKRMKMRSFVDYICFDYDAGLKVLELDKRAEVSFLSYDGSISPAQLKQDGYTGFDYHFNLIKKHPEWVAEAKQLGITSNVWTVDQLETMKWLLELGVDYITTDEPEMLLDLLK